MRAPEVAGKAAGVLCRILLVFDDFHFSGPLHILLLLLYDVDSLEPFVSLFDIETHLVTLGE